MSDKQKLDEQTIAMRAAREFEDGMVVNLGGGIPTLACNFVPEGREVLFHAENGALGYGGIASTETADWDLFNASFQPVTPLPGMSFFAHDESFALIRGGHVDISVLGALEVSEKGDLANWVAGDLTTFEGDITDWIGLDRYPPAVGGAMDLAIGAKRVIVCMLHTTRNGQPKIVKECKYELTASRCVSLIITDLAVIEITPQGLVLKEITPGWEPEDVQAVTEPRLILASDIKEISL
ncbi:MAG TPA: succinyl-CoA--3-ketoacid-CoA transferase [Dehalococcoidia bacterium]|nr:succinyl-CoA--3-ketoacid-CoA transferase [Dehalococcoidia bacterium]